MATIKTEELLNQLATEAKILFDIDISVSKMLLDNEYFDLVIGELGSLDSPELNLILANLKGTKPSSAPPSESGKQRYFVYLGAVGLCIALVAAAFLYLQSQETVETRTVENQSLTNNNQAALANDKNVTTESQTEEYAIKEFQLHGSNTIGEKLAPALLEAFLTKKGASNIEWQTGQLSVERTLSYTIKDKKYQVDMAAHGSSTAFKGLKNDLADMGMASRRVKPKEISLLRTKTGDLSKVGNEHIIALDGLAVIVNQNNPLKAITTKTLAAIYSGEINNWSQIGGERAPITLYSRDGNSGTWDTFKSLVLKKHGTELSRTALRFESSSELSRKVSQDEHAIGFIGLNYIGYNKALAISEGEGTKAIYPTRFTIATEDYALARRLYFYTPTNSKELVKEFAHFAISDEGQKIVQEQGLISQSIRLENVISNAQLPPTYQKYATLGQRLSLNFRFNYANKDLDNKGKRDLQRLVSFVEQNPEKKIVLMGFSDSIGEKAKNQLLSLRRAKVVEQELNARGITVYAVEGLGELLPVANNDSELGRERNRRVEVWVL